MTRTRTHRAVLAVMAAMALLLILPSLASAAPANDDFTNRQAISGQSASVAGTNVGATLQSGDPRAVAGTRTSHTVWYRWTAPFSGPVRIDTCASNFDTVLGVYTGSTLGSLTGRVASDDACGLGSVVRFNATDNTTYQILVDGYSGSEGAFTLEVNLTRVIDCRIGQRVCAGTDTSDRMLGTRSEDNIQSRGGEDQIYGGRAGDLAVGGTGNDVVNGMKGRDRLAGGYGNDVIHTGGLDGARDAVNCGPGRDTVYRERRLDTVSDDCEEVRRYDSGGGGGGY
jgi:Ca2+-binding RTX toxin-like protein